jgi:hypothetical protein
MTYSECRGFQSMWVSLLLLDVCKRLQQWSMIRNAATLHKSLHWHTLQHHIAASRYDSQVHQRDDN